MKDYSEDIIKYRINKAKDLLPEIKRDIENNFLLRAPRVLYYTCYYCVSALLLTKGFSPKSHSGCKHLFLKEIIANNIFDRKYGIFYAKLFDYRQENDYKDLVIADKALLEEYFLDTQILIDLISSYISINNFKI